MLIYKCVKLAIVEAKSDELSYAEGVPQAKEYADNHPDQPKIIYINAWNEWVEGSYLLPDKLNGFGYLEAVRKVFKGE